MTPSQAYKAALEAAADRVLLFSAGGKYSNDQETELLNHLAAAIRALPVPEDAERVERFFQINKDGRKPILSEIRAMIEAKE